MNPLFVLLDDTEIIRKHLSWVSQWMVMSTYSTWLLFIHRTTSIESYFKNVHVSIDSTFLVSQQVIASSEEQIMCIYSIEKSISQVKKFTSWTKKAGLTEVTNVLNKKATDFYGKVINIGFHDVRLSLCKYIYYC